MIGLVLGQAIGKKHQPLAAGGKCCQQVNPFQDGTVELGGLAFGADLARRLLQGLRIGTQGHYHPDSFVKGRDAESLVWFALLDPSLNHLEIFLHRGPAGGIGNIHQEQKGTQVRAFRIRIDGGNRKFLLAGCGLDGGHSHRLNQPVAAFQLRFQR